MADDSATLAALVARIDELESRQAIIDLTSDYCHGFDKRDFDRFLAIWSEDCVWNIGPPFGSFSGHDGIREAVQEILWPAWQESHHLSTNHVIRFQDADNATCVCDVDCVGTLTGDTDCQIVGATYTDTVRRQDGCWKIIQRDVKIHYFNPILGVPLQAPQG